MTTAEYKKKMQDFYGAYCDLINAVRATNGFRYNCTQTKEYYYELLGYTRDIESTIERINPDFNYSTSSLTVAKYETILKRMKSTWVTLGPISIKYFPKYT